MFEEYQGHDVAVYAGYLNDNEKLLQSTSGGIATALTEHMLSQGGYVAGVSYSKDYYRAEYILIHDPADAGRLKGSKYIECDKNNIYSDVKALLASGEKVLFFGLPCTVAALYRVIGSKPQNLLTCELICFGPTNPKIHQEYLAYLENKYKCKVADFSVRHKKDCWNPYYLYARFSNGETFEKPFYETEYGYAFSVFGRRSCYNCTFKGNNRQGDIMIGDFWGATENDIYWNRNGVSSVFAETAAGNAFLLATPGISLFPTTFEKAVQKNLMVIHSKAKPANYEKFSKLLEKKGLLYAAHHSPSLKSKITKAVSRFVPKSIKALAKKYITI